MIKHLDDFIDIAKKKGKKRVVIAAAADDAVIHAAELAKKEGIATPIFVGNQHKIEKIAKEYHFSLTGADIVHEDNPAEATKRSIRIIHENHADILMKGIVDSPTFLKAILDREQGLRDSKLLSHISFFETPHYHKVIAMSDAAQNIAPSLKEKKVIINNTVSYFHRLGVECPKIAVIAAIEAVNTKMEATTDAALLTVMNQRKQITGCVVDGPLAIDVALSKEAAQHKGLESTVAGNADFLLVPTIEVGNVFYKSIVYMGGATAAGILLGAKVPVVLTSRADTDRIKLLSMAMAVAY